MCKFRAAMSAAIFTSISALSGIPNEGHAQTGAALGVTLGFFLSGALGKIDKIISEAKQAARSTIIDAGQQAAWTISDAQTAYKDSLDQTVSTLNPKIQTTVSNIETMLKDIEGGTASDIENALEKSQEIVNSLPLSKTFPQLTEQSPKLVAPATSATTRVILSGNFVDAARSDYRPRLHVGSDILEPIGVTTQQLIFEVKNAALGAADENSVKAISFNLDVPYRDWYWFLFYQREVATFVLPMGLLPTKPGTAEYVASIAHEHEETRESSQAFTAVSYEGIRGFCAHADTQSGWHVVTDGNYPQPPIFNEHGNRKGSDNDWTNAFSSASPDAVCWDFWLDDGDVQIDFAIPFREHRTVKELEEVKSQLDLKWNGSVAGEIPNTGNWLVNVKPFDGEMQQFAGPGTSVPPYFTIGTQNSSVIIKSAPPPELH
ncbi:MULTISPECIES: hypothetical protein [Mesorhizobium]|uniref:hypothetical protein n=1 Tax=Mesorhizobium TaxID=68287 RepID=UPI0010A959A2|nr:MULTISPECIES: hypothetical protein [Mesorhizobium]